MTDDYLFSGSDISGRSSLFIEARTVARSCSKALATTVATFAISLTAFAVMPISSPLTFAGTVAAAIDISDSLLERVWKVRSENIQPNDKARRAASMILSELEQARLPPDRILADPDGGVALYVFGTKKVAPSAPARHGRLLAANEGNIIALCVDYGQQQHDAWEVDAGDIASAVTKIRSFVLG